MKQNLKFEEVVTPLLYRQVKEYLESEGYFLDASVWMRSDSQVGFVLSYSPTTVGIMVYTEERADSGYFLSVGTFTNAVAFVQNINFLEQKHGS